VGAISLAVEMVNARVDQFGGKQLRFQWREADCDSSDSMAQLSLMLEAGPVDAVIGPDCSLACESSAYLTAGRNILQISYRHATSRELHLRVLSVV
jgi:ABC-type branched-subunit amino acid transport system substrate-binding protein